MLLQVEGLCKAFGGLRAVDDLSFELTEGEILGLLGPNGSGKTTVFNLIAGALRADAGRVRLLDEPLGGLNATEVETALALFRKIRADAITLVIVEHNVPAVRLLCDRIIVLNSGRPIAEGKPDEALARPEVIEVYLGR